MEKYKGFFHPYVPNAAPDAKKYLLDQIGVDRTEDLYSSVPEDLQVKGALNIPPPLSSEADLRNHIEELIGKNKSCVENLNFCGAGCWQHYIPAICDEITGRGEFLTAYAGGTYSDHGKNQAIFEFQSLIGELVGMEVVGTPAYDMGAAVNSAIAMACRINGKREVLLPRNLSSDRLSQIRGFTKPIANLSLVDIEESTGLISLDDLRKKLTPEVGAVYIENPSYLGLIESRGQEIADMVHDAGGMLIVGVDPLSLGILAPPASYGADLVCGDIQPLGIHMYAGGGCAGFIASRDEEQFVSEFPMILVSIAPGKNGEGIGFGWSTMQRTSYDKRHDSEDYAGTTQWLWGIGAAVYLSLMGPRGIDELGRGILQRSHYAAQKLNGITGISIPHLEKPFFKEFIVDFQTTGKSVSDINDALLSRGIFGGKCITDEYPFSGEVALYCVTEMHSKKQIDTLVHALEEILS